MSDNKNVGIERGWWIVEDTRFQELSVMFIDMMGYGWPSTTMDDRFYQPNQMGNLRFICKVDIDRLASQAKYVQEWERDCDCYDINADYTKQFSPDSSPALVTSRPSDCVSRVTRAADRGASVSADVVAASNSTTHSFSGDSTMANQKYVFPFSFDQKVHNAIRLYKQMYGNQVTRDWPFYSLATPQGVISVIGGDPCCGWWGDGIHTFEAWFPKEPEPRTVTAEQINEWLKQFG